MKAIKENKVYTIDETLKKSYLARGFDIADDNFNIIEYSPTASVSYAEYEKVKNELEELKIKNKK